MAAYLFHLIANALSSGCSWRDFMLLLRCRLAWCQADIRQPVIRWRPYSFRHDHGAFAAAGVGVRAPVAIGVAVAVAFAAGFVEEQAQIRLAMRS